MSKCPECKGEMKPLFNGEFCPNECDLPTEKRTKSVAKTTSVDSGDIYGPPSSITSPGGTDTFHWDGNKWIRLKPQQYHPSLQYLLWTQLCLKVE